MTARDATLDIQTAMYGVATADGTLMGLVSGVFDEVPGGTNKPYVAIGEALETPDNSHDRFGRESVVTWHVWSDHQGFAEALGIANRLIEIFDHKTLTVANHTTVSVRFEFLQTLRDPDPEIRHVPVRFRVVTEQV
jgi:hypothetical protein